MSLNVIGTYNQTKYILIVECENPWGTCSCKCMLASWQYNTTTCMYHKPNLILPDTTMLNTYTMGTTMSHPKKLLMDKSLEDQTGTCISYFIYTGNMLIIIMGKQLLLILIMSPRHLVRAIIILPLKHGSCLLPCLYLLCSSCFLTLELNTDTTTRQLPSSDIRPDLFTIYCCQRPATCIV